MVRFSDIFSDFHFSEAILIENSFQHLGHYKPRI
jgi:hypothetical protein